MHKKHRRTTIMPNLNFSSAAVDIIVSLSLLHINYFFSFLFVNVQQIELTFFFAAAIFSAFELSDMMIYCRGSKSTQEVSQCWFL